jgi:putative heme-binding domain-containing protein
MALRNQVNSQPAWEQAHKLATDVKDATALADVSLGVPNAEASNFIAKHLPRIDVPLETKVAMARHVARYGLSEDVGTTLAYARDKHADLGHQFQLLKAIHQGTQERRGHLSTAFTKWADDLTGKLLAAKDRGQVQAGAELATLLRLEAFLPRLKELATMPGTDEPQRVAACNALATMQPKIHCELLGKILTDGSEPHGLQEQVAEALTRANLPETRAELLKALPTAPARLQTGIAMRLAGSREGAEALLVAIAAGKASARLLQERAVVVRLEQTRARSLKDRLATLTKGLPPADQKLLETLGRRRAGYLATKPDVALGAKLYEKQCAICHQLANQGAKIGPQLDGIGIRGVDRLLEDLLDPNRNVDQTFRSTTLLLKNGQVLNGLVLREEGAVIILADNQGKEVRVPAADVEERKLQQTSPMPANVLDLMTEGEFYHLLGFLLEQRVK